MSLATGEFSPWKSKQGNSNKQRMAGDYLSEFTNESNVMKVLGAKDNRNGVKNSDSNSSSSSNSSVSQPASAAKPSSNDAGIAKYNAAQDEIYKQNQAIIANYNGKNANNSTANGAAYNADVMSGINYDRAVRQNEKLDAIKASQASMAAGNDHGSGKNKAPKSKDYYSYLDTYDGPKSYDEVTQLYKAKEAQMGAEAAWADSMKLGKEKARPYDKWEQWNKDKMDYEAAWGSGKSVAQQKGWN